MKYIFLLLIFILTSCNNMSEKKIIGETAYIAIKELDIEFLSRIDTGATSTSIHAKNVKVTNSSANKQKNVGKKVTFETENNKGEKKTFTGKIIRVSKVSNSQGKEYRYEVKMSLGWKGEFKTVSVNLRDRSKMTYKLLIGRDWLAHDYLVDIDREAKKK